MDPFQCTTCGAHVLSPPIEPDGLLPLHCNFCEALLAGDAFANVIARAGARRCIVCSNGPRAEAYWHRDNGLPRPDPTVEDRRAERAAIVRDAMDPPPLPPPPPQGRHRRRQYRAKHRYRSKMQRLKKEASEAKGYKIKLFRWLDIVSKLSNLVWQLQRLDWRTISDTVLDIAKPTDIGIVLEHSCWMMLRLRVSRRQTLAVASP
jgi:hypothetical protein